MIRLSFRPSPTAQPVRFQFLGLAEWRPGLRGEPAVVVLHPRRLLVAMALLAVVGWCGGAAVLWQWLHARGYPSVRYADLVLPARWGQVAPSQAEDLLIQARHAMLRGDVMQAFWKGRAAIRKAPRSLDTYEFVGLLCARHWLMADARATLRDGLEVGVPRHRYLQLQLEVAQMSDDTDTVLELTERYWRSDWRRSDPASRLLLAAQRARALLQQERWSDALAWARELRARRVQPITLIDVEAYALLRLGRMQEAKELLSSVPLEFARQHDGVIRLLAEVHHRSGDMKSFRYAMRYYLDQAGGQPERHLDVLGYCRMQPDLQADFEAGLAAYYDRFGGREDAMAMLAEFLLHHRALPELERLHGFARDHLFPSGTIDVPYVQALLFAGEETQAATLLGRLPRLAEDTTLGVRVLFLRRLLETHATDLNNAAAPLANFLAQHSLPLDESIGLFDLFHQRGRFDDAGFILENAARNYPHSRRLAERVEKFKRERALLGGVASTGTAGQLPP